MTMVGTVGRRTVVSAAATLTLVIGLVTLGSVSASGAFQIEVPNVVINEVHYEPSPGGVEFIELLNPTAEDIDLSGMEIDAIGEPYVFPVGTTIPAGATVILTSSATGFATQYPNATPAAILEYPGTLDPEGELVQLALEDGTEVDSVPYLNEDPWPTAPDGSGPSLSLFDATSDNELSESWGISATPGGTPGAANDTIAQPPDLDLLDPVVLVESPGDGDVVVAASSVDVSGSSSDDVSGVVRVRVRVWRIVSGAHVYWDGAGWVSSASTWIDVVVNPDGSWVLSGVDLSVAGRYRVHVIGYDAVGNVSWAGENPRVDFTVDGG